MKKNYKFFLIFYVLLFGSFCIAGSAFAAELEVEYPALSTGASVTSQTPLPEYLKYVFDFGMFLGFVAVFGSLVYAGVLYFLSPVVTDALLKAKGRISGAISGLLILATLYLIITTINPQLKFFKMNKLEAIPPAPPPVESGVYFYNSNDCSGSVNPDISSIPDLGDKKNNINSVKIAHDPDQNTYYVSILYSIINYWGQCQWVNPNKGCQDAKIPVSSASIHKYRYSTANDSDVWFYRKSFGDDSGGWTKIKGSQIREQGIYLEKLEKLSFVDPDSGKCTVPEKDQDCVEYNQKGICTKRECPSLAGENITSITASAGHYLILLIYFDKNGPSNTPTFCQEFPTIYDVNRKGPMQVKWENARQAGMLPNYLVIVPIDS